MLAHDSGRLTGYRARVKEPTFADTDSGELQERRLQHREEAEMFYRDLAEQGGRVCVGMEAKSALVWAAVVRAAV
jgi:hypothetical protein